MILKVKEEVTMKSKKSGKIMAVKLFSLAAGAALMAGCATTTPPPPSDVLLPEIDVVQVKENSDEALKLAQEAKLDVEAMNTKIMEFESRLNKFKEDLSQISIAKIEEIENTLTLMKEEIKELQKIRVSPASAKKEEPAFKAKAAKPDTTSLKPKAADKPQTASDNENAIYEKGRGLYNAKDYQKAIAEFKKIIQSYPTGKMTDNAYFWTGECYYNLKDYAEAIKAYQAVFSFTTTEKDDDAQFKIASCFKAMGDATQAYIEFEKLINLFPSSEYVSRAKKEMEELK